MYPSLKLFSNTENQIYPFLKSFYPSEKIEDLDSNVLEWEIQYENPIEIVDAIGCLIENNDKFSINMWLNMDADIYLNITEDNADEIIRYLFERFPY